MWARLPALVAATLLVGGCASAPKVDTSGSPPGTGTVTVTGSHGRFVFVNTPVYWTFTVGADGSLSNLDAHAATNGERDRFREAVSAWNDQANGPNPAPAGQHPVPALTYPP